MTLSGAVAAHGVALTIADNGIGIDPGDVARVCEPFWQAEPVLSRRYGGTGLGMPLVQALVDLHDGSLKIESVVGQGNDVLPSNSRWLPKLVTEQVGKCRK